MVRVLNNEKENHNHIIVARRRIFDRWSFIGSGVRGDSFTLGIKQMKIGHYKSHTMNTPAPNTNGKKLAIIFLVAAAILSLTALAGYAVAPKRGRKNAETPTVPPVTPPTAPPVTPPVNTPIIPVVPATPPA